MRCLRTNPDPCETNWHHPCPEAIDRDPDRTDIVTIIRDIAGDDNSRELHDEGPKNLKSQGMRPITM